MTCHLSIVSPIYRAEDCLLELYRRVCAAAGQITSDFELVLVDDDSPDRSWEILKDLAVKDSRVKAAKLSRNYGQHYAISAGLELTQGDWVVVMDCDLQDRPEDIVTLYNKAQEGFDMVFARRKNRKDSWFKRTRSRIFASFIGWLTGTHVDGAVANFSICSKKAVEAFRQYRERDRSYGMIMADIGFPTAFVDIEHAPRYAGTTSYSLSKLIRFALQVVVASSTRPLRLSIRLGAFISLFSFIYTVYLIARYFIVNVGVPGWTTLAVLVSFFFGLLFIQLGIIGLYLGRVFEETKQRPLYHLSETMNL